MNAPADLEVMQSVGEMRLPPHSVEAEQAVLGGVLIVNRAFDGVADALGEADFYRLDHRIIWAAMARLIGAGKPADVLTVADQVKAAGKLQEAGGLPYLHQLASGASSAANIRHHAAIVRERAQRRALIEAAGLILDDAWAPAGGAVSEIAERAQASVMAAVSSANASAAQPMAVLVAEVMGEMDERAAGRSKAMSTGLIDLDRQLNGGFRGRRLYVLGGRPSSGKSALAGQLALNLAENQHRGLIFSLEMGRSETTERALANVGQVKLDRIIEGKLVEDDWDRFSAALTKLNALPLAVDDTPALTLNQLRARVRAHRVRHRDLAFVVVDYLQLMHGDTASERRDLEVTQIAEGLKALAKELDLVVIALAQVGRKCEDRVNKRPLMSDLRESGGIEAAADVIAFVYRDEMYDEASPERGVAEIIFRKARQGRIGTVRTIFLGQFSRFENYAGTPNVGTWLDKPKRARKSFATGD